jgi:hypothetical protein
MALRWGWIALACVVGCGGKVEDGSDRSNAEILQDEQDELCASICDSVISCGAAGAYEPSDMLQCQEGCAEVATDALASGDSCAGLALDAFRCYDALSCEEIGARTVGGCDEQMDNAARCGREEGDNGGGAVADSSGEEPGSSCWDGARATDPAVGEVACDQGCSGPPERAVTCTLVAESLLSCECREDGVLVSSFETTECAGDLLGRCP